MAVPITVSLNFPKPNLAYGGVDTLPSDMEVVEQPAVGDFGLFEAKSTKAITAATVLLFGTNLAPAGTKYTLNENWFSPHGCSGKSGIKTDTITVTAPSGKPLN